MSRRRNVPEGKVAVMLSHEDLGFLMHNCAQNLSMGLAFVMQCRSVEEAQPVLDMNERFKSIRMALRKAARDEGLDIVELEESYDRQSNQAG